MSGASLSFMCVFSKLFKSENDVAKVSNVCNCRAEFGSRKGCLGVTDHFASVTRIRATHCTVGLGRQPILTPA